MDEQVPVQNASEDKELEPRQKNQNAEKGPWRSALMASWKPIFRIDRSKITAFQAIRSTLGVVLPRVFDS